MNKCLVISKKINVLEGKPFVTIGHTTCPSCNQTGVGVAIKTTEINTKRHLLNTHTCFLEEHHTTKNTDTCPRSEMTLNSFRRCTWVYART